MATLAAYNETTPAQHHHTIPSIIITPQAKTHIKVPHWHHLSQINLLKQDLTHLFTQYTTLAIES